jgi:hypothetical protein
MKNLIIHGYFYQSLRKNPCYGIDLNPLVGKKPPELLGKVKEGREQTLASTFKHTIPLLYLLKEVYWKICGVW